MMNINPYDIPNVAVIGAGLSHAEYVALAVEIREHFPQVETIVVIEKVPLSPIPSLTQVPILAPIRLAEPVISNDALNNHHWKKRHKNNYKSKFRR